MAFHHYPVFVSTGTVLPEEVQHVMPNFIDHGKEFVLQPVALPHAPVGNKYAYIPSQLYIHPRYADVLSALDDHMDNVDFTTEVKSVGEYLGYERFLEVGEFQYSYDTVVLHVYVCAVA